MDNTRTQYRAFCPACFAQQAVSSTGKLAQHGYRRPQQWHQNVNVCSGAGIRHFGTGEGRAYTAALAVNVRQQSTAARYNANEVAAGRGTVWGSKRVDSVRVACIIEHPTDVQRAAYARQQEAHATALWEAADDLDAKVAAWSPAEPTPVTVAKAVGPLVHWRTDARWRGQGKACAGSYQGATKGATSRDVAHVTCEKCKALAAKAVR